MPAQLGETTGDTVVAGSYDPKTGIVTINAAATAEDARNYIIKHELTHSVEGTRQWDQLADIVQAQMGDEGYSTAVAQMMEERAASGQPVDMPTAEQEVVANWVGDNLYKGGFAQAIVSGDATVGNAFVRTIDKLRLALGNKKSRANTQLKVVERLFMRALEQEVELRDGDVEYAFKGYDPKTGKPIYESNFPIGTPKAAKSARILELIQTVWSKNPIELVINDGDGQSRKIQAHFDPTYDAETGERSDASKLMGGNRHGTASEQRVTLDLADDYYQIASDAVYNYSKDETGKDGVTHKDVSQWHYFINDILFQEYGKEEATPFRVTINVKERSDGLFVYSFNAERQNKGSSTRQTLHADVTAANNSSNARSNNSIFEDVAKSNPQSKNLSKNAVVNRAWMMGDTTVDRESNAVENPVSRQVSEPVVSEENVATPVETPVRSQVQNGEVQAATPATTPTTPAVQETAPRRVESVDYEALRNATTVDDVVNAVGDSEAFRRMYLASWINRPRETVDVDGRTMTADEYMAEQYHRLPDDEGALRAAIGQTEAALADELKQVAVNGVNNSLSFDLSDHPNILKLNIQLFAEKAKLDYVLDQGEDGSKTRRFFEQRLKGKDANHNAELVEMLKGRSETYNPIGNQKTLDKANAYLRDSKNSEELRRRIFRYNPKDIFTDVEMAAAQVMINDAINDGELGEAADLTQGLSRKGTDLGRAVQIMSMQARLTPEGTLRAMLRTLQKAADKIIGEGASDSIDQLGNEIIDVIEERVRQIIPQSPAATDPLQGGLDAGDVIDLTNDSDLAKLVEGVYGSEKYKRIQKYILDVLGDQPIVLSDGREAIVDNRDALHIANKSGAEKTAQLAQLKKLIETAELYAQDKHPQHNKFDHFFYYRTYVKYGEETIPLFLNVGRGKNDGKYHLYDITKKIRDTADRINGLERPKPNEGYALTNGVSIDSIPNSPQNVKREDLRDALVEDLAATPGNYLSKNEIAKLVDKVIDESSNIPEQVKRYVKKHLGTGTLAARIYEMQQKGHLNNVTLRRAMEEALGLPTLTPETML